MAIRSRWIAVSAAALLAFGLGAESSAQSAADAPPPGSPPPVNTNDHPDALILNQKNSLAVHAGPGKPNVGAVFIPPTLSGKDKGKGQKAGATEQSVMGATPK